MFNSELLPVQLLYLQKPAKANIQSILSFVLQDLIIRRILNLKALDTFPNNRSKKTQKYFVLLKGENYVGYKPKYFEKEILCPYDKYEQLQPKTITNKILRKYSVPTGYIDDEIVTSLKNEGYINAPSVLKAFGIHSITSKGKQIVADLNHYLAKKEQQLTYLIDGDKEQFIQVMNEMGTLVFIFKKDNPDLFKNIISMVKRIHRSKPLGHENDLSNFKEAINIDLSFLGH